MTTMRFAGLPAALLVVSALAPGCNSSPKAGETTDDLAQSICDAAFRCCLRGEIDFFLGPFVDEENCADRMHQRAEQNAAALLTLPFEGAAVMIPNIGVLERAIEEDRATIDEQALRACIDYLVELPCNELLDEPEPEGCQPPEPEIEYPCDPELIVIGRVGSGGACTSPGTTLECKTGLVCQRLSSLGVEGVCVQPGLEGDFCYQDSECDEELYCSLLDGTCRVPRSAGETCAFADENDPTPDASTLLIQCAEDLSCDPITDTCVARCERGSSCASDADCDEEAGLRCIVGRCDSPRDVGLPCQTAEDCADGTRCGLNPRTGTDTVCLDLLAEGDSCSTSRHEDCATGFCDPNTAQCAPTTNPGGLCPTANHNQCDGGYCETDYQYCTTNADCAALSGTCNTSSSRCEYFCISLQPDGATCVSDYECQSDDCVNGFCRTTPLADGQPCDSSFQCASGFCNYESPRECEQLPLPNGRACSTSSECESGVCHDNSCQNGLSEGADCGSFLDPPCGRDLFCDRDQSPSVCVPVYEAGTRCEDSSQCRGTCVMRFNRLICDSTPTEGAAVCDGE